MHRTIATPSRSFKTPLGDLVTTHEETDEDTGMHRTCIEIETTLTLVREAKSTRDTGRNWEH